MNKIRLSVVISAYNEEKNLEGCLRSVEKLADEIIVVDNSSLDDTAKIAKKYTDKVYQQKNDPRKIDEQKNFGFSKATGDWIFSIDADEKVTLELGSEIKKSLDKDKNADGYWIPRKNIIFGKWIKSDMWWPDYQLKLFRKGAGSFRKNDVHKALEVIGATQKLENPLLHNNYSTISQYLVKLNNYTDIEAENITSGNYTFSWLDAVRFPVDDFVKTFFLQKGYGDGLHGLVLSMLQAFYMEVVFAKIWEKHKFVEIENQNFLQEVNKELKKSKDKVKYWFTTALIRNSNNPIKKIALRAIRKITTSDLKKS